MQSCSSCIFPLLALLKNCLDAIHGPNSWKIALFLFHFMVLSPPIFFKIFFVRYNIFLFTLEEEICHKKGGQPNYQKWSYAIWTYGSNVFFFNFEQGLLKTGQSWDIQIFPIFLVSLATARKHWLGYFSLPPWPPWEAGGPHNIKFVL